MGDFYIDNKGIIGVPPGIPGSLPSKHAKHHITGGTDVIPNATDVNSGLMSPTDKQKLDAITQEKIDTWNTVTEKANKVDVYTKSEVNNLLSQAGYGDMMKATYDADNDGVVDLAKDADTVDGKHYSDIENKIQSVEIKYAVASGTNVYTAFIPGITAITEGLSVKIKFQNANTGACTLNINGLGAKPIKKANGNDLSAGNIKAGQICHLVYNGVNFQLLGEGGEYGTAQPEHVLEGYTIGTDEGLKEGTMPNQGRKIITPGTTNIAIPAGYHDGTGYVVGSPNLIPANIKKGVNIFDIIGTLETQITVQPISFSTTLTAPETTEPEYNRHMFNTIIITLPPDFKMFIYKSNSFSSSGVTMSAPYEYSSNKSWATLDFGSRTICSVDLDGNQKKFLFDLMLAIRLPNGTTKYLVTYTDPNDSNGDNFNYDDYCKFIPEGDFESASINWANPKISIYSSIYDSHLGSTSFDIIFNGILYVIQ